MTDIASTIITIASIITALGVISAFIGRAMNKVFKRVDKLDIRECRAYLIGFMRDLENGYVKDEVEWEYAHEVYDHYTNDLKQNSYIHDKWVRVTTKGAKKNEKQF
mgnify:FL=1